MDEEHEKHWEEVTGYRCKLCEKVYYGLIPTYCTCRSPFEIGRMIGPFVVVGAKENGGNVPVECLLCDTTKSIHYSALSRQKSCGCKPRHITIADITRENVRYFCKKCQRHTTQVLPVMCYCCENGDDNDS